MLDTETEPIIDLNQINSLLFHYFFKVMVVRAIFNQHAVNSQGNTEKNGWGTDNWDSTNDSVYDYFVRLKENFWGH